MLPAGLGRTLIPALLLGVLPAAAHAVSGPAPEHRPVVAAAPSPDDRDNTGWAEIRDDHRSRSAWKVRRDLAVGRGQAGERRRAYYVFDTRELRGAHIVSAEVNLLQTWAASCRRHRTRLHPVGPVGSQTTWATAPTPGRALDANSSTAGCDGIRDFVGWDATEAVRAAAEAGAGRVSFLLRAADESTRRAAKRFARRGELSVRYVRTPYVPTDLQLRLGSWAPGCGTEAEPVAIGPHASVTTSGVLRSPEGTQADLHGVFTLTDVTATSAPEERVGSRVASGDRGAMSWPVTSGSTYRWTVTNRVTWQQDGTDHHLDSQPAGPCWFTVG